MLVYQRVKTMVLTTVNFGNSYIYYHIYIYSYYD